ncbi:MAG: 3'-5' exonuclease [Chitinophagaceae bacterium]
MQLTQEQKSILSINGNVKINAVAGSGKTTTIIEYAKQLPKDAKVIYIAFNKTVKDEAALKFASLGLQNIRVETAHSLAYKNIVVGSGFTLKANGYKTQELPNILEMQGNAEKHYEFIIANHILKLVSLFCNSSKQKVEEVDYLATIDNEKTLQFVKSCLPFIVLQTRRFLAKMNNKQIEITHDFYLKKFQLAQPILPYQYILFDEAQDASAAMLDVVLKQQATKIIVGDTHQQIYSWRYAINSLEQVAFATLHLTNSFRFNDNIASLANDILNYKKTFFENQVVENVIGVGKSQSLQSKATIARTNIGLLVEAISYVTNNKKVATIYFEGNINSYTYADDGTSLYDVLFLYNNQHSKINDPLIKSMKQFKDLEEFIDKTSDMQLGMLVEIVKEYENEIFDILKLLKEKHVSFEQKNTAKMIFTTVHRCKGLEYDEVYLAEDFITKDKLEKQVENGIEPLKLIKLNEEVNLLYVAITRAKTKLYIPYSIVPPNFALKGNVIGIKQKTTEADKEKSQSKVKSNKGKAYNNTFNGDVVRFEKSYQPWSDELDDELTILYCKNMEIEKIANKMGRSKGSIWARIKRLQLEDLYG